jgi:hypothetical protein
LKKNRATSKIRLWFHEKEPLYFAALKKDVVWLKKNLKYEKKIGMPVKWLEAEEI